MKLTNTIRDAFVRAAMDDVPNGNFQDQLNKLVMDDAVAQLPPKVRALWSSSELRPYVKTHNPYRLKSNTYIPALDEEFKLSETAAKKYDELVAAMSAEQESRKELRSRLRSVAYAASTRKQLVDLLPEFEKYLPAYEKAAIRTLPVVANVVTDFMKAGWPKGGKLAKAA